ncbi:A24 family peptidase, partial [Mycolicibacterium fortuitum]|uniref:prepilin peptidase n=1 Tax=Mycolicibacterium fortuitum TaxID=1766 RepID=UPI001F2FA4F2
MGVGLIVAAGAWLSVLSGYDIAERRLPNWLTLPGAVVVPVVAGVAGRGVPALAGAAALSVLYLAVHLLSPGAMGGGDVKLAFGLGAMTGAFGVDVWLLAALAAHIDGPCGTERIPRRAAPSASTALTNGAARA